MLTIVVWKEWRQQGLLLVAILALACIALGSAAVWVPHDWANLPAQTRLLLASLLVALAIVQGLVTGAILFAGETEDGTLEFLDSHGRLREPLWRAKMLAGLSIVLPASLALGVLLLGLNVGVLGMLLCVWLALDTFFWSALCSAGCTSTFRAIGVAMPVLFGVTALPSMILLGRESVGLYFFIKVPALAVALFLSRQWFCWSDFERAPRTTKYPWLRLPGWLTVPLWIAWTRHRVLIGVVMFGAVCMGVVEANSARIIVSPLYGLILGCVCGWAVFAEEQGQGCERFLGERRLPRGRLWLGKVLPWLILVVVGCALSWFVAEIILTGRRDYDVTWLSNWWWSTSLDQLLYLLIFPLFGFATALLVTQQARKLPVAVFVTLLLVGGLVMLWYPSLYAGMSIWPAWVLGLGLLAVSRAAMARWTSGRLHDLGGLLRIALVILLVTGWSAGVFAWRAFEFSNPGPPFSVKAFERDNAVKMTPKGGEPELAQAAADFWPLYVEIRESIKPDPGAALPGADDPPEGFWDDFLEYVVESGFPERARKEQEALDRLVAGDWVEPFRRAALEPPAILQRIRVPPRFSFGSAPRKIEPAEQVAAGGKAFLARAMSALRQGRKQEALADLEVGLAASRHALYLLAGKALWHGLHAHLTALKCAETMTTRTPGDPVFWAQLAGVLARHEEALPSFADNIKTNYIWADPLGTQPMFGVDTTRREMVQLLRSAPWERERDQRMINSIVATMLTQAELRRFPPPEYPYVDLTPYAGTPPPGQRYRNPSLPVQERWNRMWLYVAIQVPDFLFDLIPQREVYADGLERLHGVRLSLAAALGEADTGKAIAGLDDLVPRYFARRPTSSYEGGAFEYRVSAGETFQRQGVNNSPLRQTAPPGQGLVWDRAWSSSEKRMVFLVPRNTK